MHFRNLEKLRRDKQTVQMRPSPLGPNFDYSIAVELENAVSTLRESLPNGQVNRTDAALANARKSLTLLESYWMHLTDGVERVPQTDRVPASMAGWSTGSQA